MRAILLSLILLASMLAPHAALAAASPTLDASFHIVPDAHDIDPFCPVGAPLSMGAVLNIIQGLVNASIAFGILIFVMVFAYAGVLLITSATNPENRSTARKLLMNAAIGLLITLSAWLIVDFVMKTLYSGPDGTKGKFGPWNSILGDGPACIISKPVQPLFSGSITAGSITTSTGIGGTGGSTGGTSGTYSDGLFTYQSGVESQKSMASQELATMLTCMAGKIPRGVGQISAITDRYSGTDSAKIAHCAAVGSQGDSHCAHTIHSSHYGGVRCVGRSYGVDFRDEQNANVLIQAARACGAARVAEESGNHVHATAPNSCAANGGPVL